jgi:hypothetical protein
VDADGQLDSAGTRTTSIPHEEDEQRGEDRQPDQRSVARTTCHTLAPLITADSSSAGSIARNAAVMSRNAIGE